MLENIKTQLVRNDSDTLLNSSLLKLLRVVIELERCFSSALIQSQVVSWQSKSFESMKKQETFFKARPSLLTSYVVDAKVKDQSPEANNIIWFLFYSFLKNVSSRASYNSLYGLIGERPELHNS